MPNISDSFGESSSLTKLSLSIFLAGYSLCQFFYGPLSDTFGRRINLTIGVLIFIFGSILCSLADDMTIFLTGRLIEGLGIGACGAVGYSLMRDIYSGHKLLVQFCYISVAVGMVPLLSPIIGGYLVSLAGWRSCFYLLTILAVLLVAAKFLFLHETLLIKNPRALLPKEIIKNYKKMALLRNSH